MQLLRAETGWDTRQLINLLILIMVFSGVFGFIYEVLFYRIDLGYFTKRGSSYGPWIPIYVFGGAAYTLLVYPFKAHPLLVFAMCVVVSGVMEYVTGWVLYEIFHTRLWDYNTEIWNWGNINGYVCLRSVMFFGVSGVLLVYVVIPILIKVMNMVDPGVMTIICRTLAVAMIADGLLYQVNHRLKGNGGKNG
ncbi:MAG: putative ABC transporter permease [Lachnospiraceae bacterium]|nr:putative ABC transporter permease [Lachnospiraceae bacterium]